MHHPEVSIVIPAYNESAGMIPSIQAALAQEYPDFEVIVVNNASTDDTESVARSFPGVKVVNEKRKGLLWAREAGRLAASGEIIANMDADCIPATDWLARGVPYFNDQKIAAIGGPYDYHDAGAFFRFGSLFIVKTIYKAMSVVVQLPLIRAGALLIGGNNMIRASVLQRCGGYNTALTFYGEDTDTAKRVVRHGKVLFLPSWTMKSSARRFKSEGVIRLEARYVYHFFKNTFRQRA